MHKLATSLLWVLEERNIWQAETMSGTEGRFIRSKNPGQKHLGSTRETSTLPIPLDNRRKGLRQETLKEGHLQSWYEHPSALHTQCDHAPPPAGDPEFSAGHLTCFKTQSTLKLLTLVQISRSPRLPLLALNVKKPRVAPMNKERASEKEPSQQWALSPERVTRTVQSPTQAAGWLKPGDRT